MICIFSNNCAALTPLWLAKIENLFFGHNKENTDFIKHKLSEKKR